MNILYPIKNSERKKLYEEVWSEPMITLAKKYGVSDTTLKKRCRKYGIPLPDAGHWAKFRAGKFVKQKPLPDVDYETSKMIREYAIFWKNNIEEITDEKLEAGHDFFLLTEDSIHVIKEFCKNFSVGKQLRNPGILVSCIIEKAEKREKAEKEVKGKDKWNYISRRTQEPLYPFQVKQQNIKRVLRIIESLDRQLYMIESSICETTPVWSNGITTRKLGMYLLGEFYDIKIIDNDSDILKIEFSNSQYKFACADTKAKRVEDEIGQTLYSMCIYSAKNACVEIVEGRRYERQQEENKRIRRIEDMRKNELKELDKLIQFASDWNKSEVLQHFLTAAEKKCKEMESSEKREQLHKFVEWGQRMVDWINPLEEVSDNILGKGTSIWDNM